MSQFVALRLRKLPVIHWYLERSIPLESTQKVLVRTQQGFEVATVLRIASPDKKIRLSSDPFVKEILGPLQDADRAKLADICKKEKEVFQKARTLISEQNLSMKLLRAEYLFDQSRLIFYFKSDVKVDFRDLLKTLATSFHTRIELRQIGVRDETRLLGGIGCCGKQVCCAQFMTYFYPVSTKMAKDQNLSLNPVKLSGICGRLLCCLAHEHEYYASFHGKFPRVGAEICIGSEKAKIMDINFITEKALAGFPDRRKAYVPLGQIHGRKEPVISRNLWWVQEANKPEPELDFLLETYQIADLVKKAREAKEAKESKKRERRKPDGATTPDDPKHAKTGQKNPETQGSRKNPENSGNSEPPTHDSASRAEEISGPPDDDPVPNEPEGEDQN